MKFIVFLLLLLFIINCIWKKLYHCKGYNGDTWQVKKIGNSVELTHLKSHYCVAFCERSWADDISKVEAYIPISEIKKTSFGKYWQKQITAYDLKEEVRVAAKLKEEELVQARQELENVNQT